MSTTTMTMTAQTTQVDPFWQRANKYLMYTPAGFSTKGYLKRMSEECRKRDMLLILDEAQTGVGRTGRMFAYEHEEGVVPDILTLSKKILGCGLPLAPVTTNTEIEPGCKEAGFLWLTTHLIDPFTAAVGAKVLEIVKCDNTCQKAAERGQQLSASLEKLQQKYWCIGDIRGRGLLQGIKIISDASTKPPGCMGGVFRLAPPVAVIADEIEEGLRILDQCFECNSVIMI
ncbi:hypothetical protein E4T39_03338 [Aureobasidium subglaciale]|nr:hypothetical protein E4T39_03338 [Aureobasidium subglaciale]